MDKPQINWTKINQIKEKSTKEIMKCRVDEQIGSVIEELLFMKNNEKMYESGIIQYNSEINSSLKNYVIIRVITIIEVFFVELTTKLIDNYSCPTEKLFPNNNIEIQLAQQKKTTTKGKIVATNFNFQNISDIRMVMNALLNIDFDKNLKIFPLFPWDKDNKFIQNWDRFFEVFKKRHLVTHSLDYNVPYSVKELQEIKWASDSFLWYSKLVIFMKINESYPVKFRDDDPEFYDIINTVILN